MNLYIPIFLGTAREGRESEKVANFMLSELNNIEGVESEILDPRVYASERTIPSQMDSEVFATYREKVKKADAYVLVVPEYNGGYPGELKIMLDSAYSEYRKKPISLAGVSAGIFGGSRVVEQIKPTLVEMGFVVLPAAMHFGEVKKLFNDKGEINSDFHKKATPKALDELIWFAKALSSARDGLSR